MDDLLAYLYGYSYGISFVMLLMNLVIARLLKIAAHNGKRKVDIAQVNSGRILRVKLSKFSLYYYACIGVLGVWDCLLYFVLIPTLFNSEPYVLLVSLVFFLPAFIYCSFMVFATMRGGNIEILFSREKVVVNFFKQVSITGNFPYFLARSSDFPHYGKNPNARPYVRVSDSFHKTVVQFYELSRAQPYSMWFKGDVTYEMGRKHKFRTTKIALFWLSLIGLGFPQVQHIIDFLDQVEEDDWHRTTRDST